MRHSSIFCHVLPRVYPCHMGLITVRYGKEKGHRQICEDLEDSEFMVNNVQPTHVLFHMYKNPQIKCFLSIFQSVYRLYHVHVRVFTMLVPVYSCKVPNSLLCLLILLYLSHKKTDLTFSVIENSLNLLIFFHRSQIRLAENQIRLRSRMSENRWSSDKCQQSAKGKGVYLNFLNSQ